MALLCSAKICDADPLKITNAFSELTQKTLNYPTVFGDGNAAEFILEKLWDHRNNKGTNS
jgi:hypothetical protein